MRRRECKCERVREKETSNVLGLDFSRGVISANGSHFLHIVPTLTIGHIDT